MKVNTIKNYEEIIEMRKAYDKKTLADRKSFFSKLKSSFNKLKKRN